MNPFRRILNAFIAGFWLGLMLTACHTVSVVDTAKTVERIEEAQSIIDEPETVIMTKDETGSLVESPAAKAAIAVALDDCGNDLPVIQNELNTCKQEVEDLSTDAAIGQFVKWGLLLAGSGYALILISREALKRGLFKGIFA